MWLLYRFLCSTHGGTSQPPGTLLLTQEFQHLRVVRHKGTPAVTLEVDARILCSLASMCRMVADKWWYIQRNLNNSPFDSISKHLSLLVKELLNVVLWETRDGRMIL